MFYLFYLTLTVEYYIKNLNLRTECCSKNLTLRTQCSCLRLQCSCLAWCSSNSPEFLLYCLCPGLKVLTSHACWLLLGCQLHKYENIIQIFIKFNLIKFNLIAGTSYAPAVMAWVDWFLPVEVSLLSVRRNHSAGKSRSGSPHLGLVHLLHEGMSEMNLPACFPSVHPADLKAETTIR